MNEALSVPPGGLSARRERRGWGFVLGLRDISQSWRPGESPQTFSSCALAFLQGGQRASISSVQTSLDGESAASVAQTEKWGTDVLRASSRP